MGVCFSDKGRDKNEFFLVNKKVKKTFLLNLLVENIY